MVVTFRHQNSPEITSQCAGRMKPKRKKGNKKTKSKEEQLEEQEEVKLTFIVAVRRRTVKCSPETKKQGGGKSGFGWETRRGDRR